MNVPYNFGSDTYMSGDEVLSRCVQLGVGAIELRSQPVEVFLNAPRVPAAPARGAQPNPDLDAQRQAARDDLRKFRLAVDMNSTKPFRQKYEDAGVMIQIVKFDGLDTASDEEVDYSFNLAKALGAHALSCEIALPLAKRLAPFAEKHQLRVGLHGHTQATPAMFEEAMSYGNYICCNVDIGHFLAGNNTSPLPFIIEHHDRITHVHVKDRKLNNGPNVPFGQGDTPIVGVLHAMRDNKWDFPAVIEFEYPIPAGSDRMTELAKCMDYCRTVLQS
jgi:sugar phosphate isomerase/epimerase